MKNILFALGLTLVLGLGFTVGSSAAPSSMKVYELEQPDGTYFSVVNRGDEWNNWVETVDGYSIEKGDDGYWFYVLYYDKDIPILSNTYANEVPPMGLEKHNRPALSAVRVETARESRVSSIEPPYGTFAGKILFILAEFTDISGTYTEADFASLINNNISDYFNKASYGKVTLSPANESSGTADNGVVGWVNLGYDHPNTGSNWSIVNRLLTANAIIAADPYVDFSAYDADSDGYVDADELAVVIVVAGYEKAYGTSYSPSVWAHKWSLNFSEAPSVDGVKVSAAHGYASGYAQVGEIHQSHSLNQHQATMGINVHELGHLIFGLPDLYDTDYSSSGIGAFGLMGSGSWGAASSDTYIGETPPLPCAWSKYNRGWVDGKRGSGITSVTAAGSSLAAGANIVSKVWAGRRKEYFLIENRQPLGYDRGLEHWLGADFGGIAIWHIDDSLTRNNDDSHRLVDLEEADATEMTYRNRGERTDLWYSGNATTFSDTTDPNSKFYDGSSSGVEITDIGAPGETMTVTIFPSVSKALPGIPLLLLDD